MRLTLIYVILNTQFRQSIHLIQKFSNSITVWFKAELNKTLISFWFRIKEWLPNCFIYLITVFLLWSFFLAEVTAHSTYVIR